MTMEKAKEFQAKIAKEALALMAIHDEDAGTPASADVSDVARYEEAVTLIGAAWGLPAEVTAENLSLIQREKDVLHRIAAGESASHVLPERELPMNATGLETLDNVWGLFETAVHLDSREQRAVLFSLANDRAECQNLLDWVKKTPAEQEMPEIAAC